MVTQAKLILLTKGMKQTDLVRRIQKRRPGRGICKGTVCQVINGLRQTAWIRRAITQELKVSVQHLWPAGKGG